MKRKEIEVLAPAGSMISFKAAIAAGADAVYVGGSSFGARAFADNFTEEQLLEAIDYAHFHGRKIFLTVNTLLKEDEIQERLYDYLLPYYKQGLDAVIVQDMGVLELVRHCFPDLPVHASTQMTITNTLGACFMKSKGVERIVPARELSLPEIQDMAEKTGLEIECFVHGALCYCYSGQCLLSSTIGGRSGNRGQCAQPCRLPYESQGKRGYLLSPKDICTLDLIPDMIDAGIYSFKIEGRMKKPEYVAAVTSMYRKYVDLYLNNGRNAFKVDPVDRQILMDIYNRGGFDDGYYKKHNGKEMISIDRPNHAGVPAFQVLRQKNREVTGKAIVSIHKGDILELSKDENYTFGQNVCEGDTFTIIGPKKKHYKEGEIIARTRNQFTIDQIDNKYVNQLTVEKVTGQLSLIVGDKSRLSLSMRGVTVLCEGDTVDEARNQPLETERIIKQMRKTGNTEYEWSDFKVKLDGNVFVPMQQLNELRRNGLRLLTNELCNQYRRNQNKSPETISAIPIEQSANEEIQMYLLAETVEQLKTAVCNHRIARIYADSNMISELLRHPDQIMSLIQQAHENGIQFFLAMPYIFRAKAVKEYETYYENFYALAMDGVLIRNYESYQFLKDHSFEKEIVLDSNLYVMNHFAKALWLDERIANWTAPVELSCNELEKLGLNGSEMIAYGKLPMMISAGCLKKTLGRCTYKPECTILKDRLKNEYIVKNYCDFCYNVLYNYEPLVLYDQIGKIRKLHPKAIRLQFTTENVADMNRMLSLYEKALSGGLMDEPDFPYTREHFRRGIR